MNMKCPHCNVDLLMTNRENVEIDYCPQCRGVWLDRGELDKIIERADQYDRSRGHYRDDDDDDDDDRRRHMPPPVPQNYQQQYPRKKKSFWSELFD
jgi:Zn-finger nucleic acid-binding protein